MTKEGFGNSELAQYIGISILFLSICFGIGSCYRLMGEVKQKFYNPPAVEMSVKK